MTERRYTEDEVATIFERAAEAQRSARRQLPSGEGMTLTDLQEIGREVGIPAELVGRAARSLDPGGSPGSRTFLGLPIGVGTTVELDRKVSDEEWERLVVDLRETFDAKGVVRYDGPFREWTNGNLQALLEPTDTGHRLRLQTLKGEARSLMTVGLTSIGVSAAILIAAAVTGTLGSGGALDGAIFMALVGLGFLGSGALRLPGWARLRRGQMEAVAARLALTGQSQDAEPTPGGS